MGIFATTFTAVATLLIIGILGFWLLSRRVIAGTILGALTVLSIDIALPSLTFTGIVSGFDPGTQSFWWTLPLWWIGFTLVALAMTVALSWVSRREFRREFRAALFFQNGIFFPLAIITEMFGGSSPLLINLFLFTLFYPAFFFNVSPLFFNREMRHDLSRVFNPVLIATAAAVIITLLDLKAYLPEFLVSGLKLVGGMTVPLLMIVLGGNIFLDLRASGAVHYGEALKFVCVKNVLFPAIALGALLLLRPPYEIALIVMLQSAVPPVTAIPIITEREGGDRNIVNQYMVASFLFSLTSLPAVIMVFSWFFGP